MKKNKFSEESQDLLSLGTLHEEVEKEKTIKKISLLPIILILIGIILMLTGFFYTDIVNFVKSYTDKNNKKDVIQKDPSITYLTCEYDKSDSTLGINNKTNMKYEFKDNKLKKTSRVLTISILDNSYEIGSNNIKILYNKYNTTLKDISINGIIIKNSIKDNKFKNTTLIDYEVLDPNQIPKVDYLTISNKKDQSYREIKEIEGRAGHICKVS